jgi:imidazolonepropionase-like amidohydrolase
MVTEAPARTNVTEAVIARGHGLSRDAALRAITLDAARILGVEDRVGNLEVGKDGDLVVWANDPVGTWPQARIVVVGGRVVFQR